jgi:hypothetical protein
MTNYTFRNNIGKGKRWSIYVERFVTSHGVIPVLEWFSTYEDAELAAEEMRRDGRFFGIHIYNRSQETADHEWSKPLGIKARR